MAFIVADRVQETTTAPGTGTVTLLGAVSGFQSFSSGIGANNTTYYVIADQSGANWEVGLGALNSTATTLTRTTVYSSSNSGATVNFATGTQNVWCDYPASQAVIQGGSVNFSSIGSGTPGTGAFTSLSASGTVSGTGFSTYLASPPAIGGTAPASGKFTSLTGTSITDSGLTNTQVVYAGAAGLLSSSANLTFNGTTLAANTLNLTNQLGTVYGGTGLTSFTSGGAVYATSTSALTTGTLPTASGGTGLASFTANRILYTSSTSAIGQSVNLQFDGTTLGTNAISTASLSSASSAVGLCSSNRPTANAYNSSGYQLQLDGTTYAQFCLTSFNSAVVGNNLNVGNVVGGNAVANFVVSKGSGDGLNMMQGITDGTVQFNIAPNGNVTNSLNSYGGISDEKLKENIVDATPKLASLMNVKVRNYNLINDPEKIKQIGVVAQELEEVFPGLVESSIDRDRDYKDLGTVTKSVKYSVLIPILVKAIQELKTEFDAYVASHP